MKVDEDHPIQSLAIGLAFLAIMRDIMREDSSRIEVDFGPAGTR
jgi:hypothetical protein